MASGSTSPNSRVTSHPALTLDTARRGRGAGRAATREGAPYRASQKAAPQRSRCALDVPFGAQPDNGGPVRWMVPGAGAVGSLVVGPSTARPTGRAVARGYLSPGLPAPVPRRSCSPMALLASARGQVAGQLRPDAVQVAGRVRPCARNRSGCTSTAAGRLRWRSRQSSRRRHVRAPSGPPGAGMQQHDRVRSPQQRRTGAGRVGLGLLQARLARRPLRCIGRDQSSDRQLGQRDSGDDRLTRQARRVVDPFAKNQRARVQQTDAGGNRGRHRLGSTAASTSRRNASGSIRGRRAHRRRSDATDSGGLSSGRS